jgi:tetratricopeptide (TPR) repeat protein
MKTNCARPLLPPRLLTVVATALALFSIAAQTSAIEQGRAALARGDSDAAIAILETAVAQSPNDAEVRYRLANAYGSKAEKSGMLAAARYAPKAKGEWEQAVALDPLHVHARFSLVEFYALAPGFMGGSHDKALEQARAIKAHDPVLGRRAHALVYMQQNKPDLAKKEYTDAIRDQPSSPSAHSFLGQHLGKVEKNFLAALAEFEAALKLDPHYMPAYYHLGRTSALAGANLIRGEEALKRYLAHKPEDNEPTSANAHYWLGMIHEKATRAAEAARSYRAALGLDPSMKRATEALTRLPSAGP